MHKIFLVILAAFALACGDDCDSGSSARCYDDDNREIECNPVIVDDS